MSNPCINRWGLKMFWHHYWHSDVRYSANLQHDALFIKLIQLYLLYGSNTDSSIFWNKFWYKTGPAPSLLNLHNYYRWLTVSNKTLQSINTYRLRTSPEEVFQTRVNVLKFNSWVVVNFYWFQPDKDKAKRARMSKIKSYTNSINSTKLSPAALIKLSSFFSVRAAAASRLSQRYQF